MSGIEDRSELKQGSDFRTTHWSVVLAAGRGESPAAAAALETLCRAYWRPLYAFVRREGRDVETAKDLTQEFFARLLARRRFAEPDPLAGRFRSWLLTALKRFLIDEWRHTTAAKRGGGIPVISIEAGEWEDRACEAQEPLTPDMAYERCWAEALLDRVMQRLGTEYSHHPLGFERLQPFLVEPKSETRVAQAAAELGITPGALSAVVFRLRRRYRELFREEVAQTVQQSSDVEEEMRHVLEVLRA